MTITAVLETSIYVEDLEVAERFYHQVLGLEVFARLPGRHVFLRCGPAVLLLFQPDATSREMSEVGGVGIPLHGSRGPGHVAFAVRELALDRWIERLAEHGIRVEADVAWPRGGRSIYFRDPDGNSLELATPRIWGMEEQDEGALRGGPDR